MTTHSTKPPHSITALIIAQAVLSCAKSKKWSHLVDPETSYLLRHFVTTALEHYPRNKSWFTIKTMNILPSALQKIIYNWTTSIGYRQHIVLRKKLIEQQIHLAIKNGVTQILGLGTRLDHIPLKLHSQYPQIEFIEMDYGLTRDTKLLAIKALKQQPGINLHFLESSIQSDTWLQTLLQQPYFDPKRDSFIYGEGLTMYLSRAELKTMLDNLRLHVLTANSRLLLSFAEPEKPKKIDVTKQLRETAVEIYRSLLFREDVPIFLKQHQYEILGMVQGRDFQLQAGNSAALLKYAQYPQYFSPEHYFLLRPNPTMQTVQNIHDVPVLQICLSA